MLFFAIQAHADSTTLNNKENLITALPKIYYNRERIEDIICSMSVALPLNVENEITNYLDAIDEQINKIHAYQIKDVLEDFFEKMLECLLEISNVTNELYKLTKVYDETLSNKIKKLILDWVEPLEKELKKRIEMPYAARDELELKTKRLYAQQSFVARSLSLQQELMSHLDTIKKLLVKPGKARPRCYISYAWPSEKNKEKEYWVQPFLYILYDHLKAAGIDMVMDVRDNKPGDSIFQFMRQYKDGNYVILVGTESLLEKHYSDVTHAVKTELSIVSARSDEDKKLFRGGHIYPMLISGTIPSSYPEVYTMYHTVKDGRELGYLELLEKLIAWLNVEQIKNNKKCDMEYLNLWRDFHNFYKANHVFLQTVDIADIEKELALGYHKQRLDYLRQDLQYQSVEVQEKTEYSNVTETKMVGALMESNGINPQNLWDAAGKQFQRPYTNPNFIQRQDIWDKMIKHFENKEQQILTLTAHGMGGMGKTELAGYYYLNPPKAYDLRAWFHASSKEQLYGEYTELVKANGIEYSKDMPIKERVKRIVNWLEDQKGCLLVYDNVEKYDDIAELLPKKGKHHILITSRNAVDWPQHQSLDVDIMSEDEAIDLIVKITGFDKEKNIDDLKKLVKMLGYLPLSLAQASSYLKETTTDIKCYLDLYQEKKYNNQKELLKYTSESYDATKHEPIWITFDINLKNLEKECPKALETLKQISWLSSFDIPEDLLLHLVEKDDSTQDKRLIWNNIKKNLKNYSLIRINDNQHLISIHPLLQNILQGKESGPSLGVTHGWFHTLINNIHSFFISKTEIVNDEARQKSLLPHLKSIYDHCNRMWPTSTGLDSIDIIKDIGQTFFLIGDPKRSKLYYEQALDILEKHYDKNHVELASTLDYLGRAYRYLGNVRHAKILHERALLIKETNYGKEHIEIATTLDYLGRSFRELGLFKQAKEIHQRSLTIKERHYDKDHLEIALTLDHLGRDFRLLGNIKQATVLHELALGIKKAYFKGEDHVQVAITLDYLGRDYRAMRNFEKAKDFHEWAVAIKEKIYSKDHVEIAITTDHLARDYRYLGNIKKAIELHEYVVKIKEAHYGKDHIEVAYTVEHLGNDYRKLGNHKQAKILHKRALKIKEKHFGVDHNEVGITLIYLAMDYRTEGNAKQAILHLEKASKIRKLWQKYLSEGIDYDDVRFNLGHSLEDW